MLLRIASITQSSNTAAHTLLVSINWQFILLFSPWYVLILLSVICCCIYVKQSWLLNVNAPLGTWFGKNKSILYCMFLLNQGYTCNVKKIFKNHQCLFYFVKLVDQTESVIWRGFPFIFLTLIHFLSLHFKTSQQEIKYSV
jgi:hypothetical protein